MSPTSRYKQALVTYIDVLGFGELVAASEKADSSISEIRRIIQVLRDQLGKGQRVKFEGTERPKPIFRAFSFSDLTVRVTFIDPEKQFVNILNREIQLLADGQLELSCSGADELGLFPVLLRGGITLGPISMDPHTITDDVIFGPALVRSYKLESETAVFPRIVIDRELIKKAKQLGGMLYTQFIKRGDDGIDFINYLFRSEEFYNDELMFMNGIGTLENHKKMIEKKVGQLKAVTKGGGQGPSDRILQKYLWLVNYHNSVVSQLPDPLMHENPFNPSHNPEFLGVSRDELLISDDLFSF